MDDRAIYSILFHPRDDKGAIELPEAWQGREFLEFEHEFWKAKLEEGMTPSQIRILWQPHLDNWLRARVFGGMGGVQRGQRLAGTE